VGVKIAGKLCILGGISLPIYLISFRWDRLLSPPPWAPGWYQVEVFLLFIPYCLALWLIWKSKESSQVPLLIVFLFAFLFRLLLLPTEPHISTDVYRHLWDGRVQVAGINPYLYAPEAEALRPLRDDAVYRWINRKEFSTVYPAGAQLLFWSLAKLGLTTLACFKAFLLLADLGSLVLLLQLLDHYQVNRLRILLYAWNPLTVFEAAHAGHLEAVIVFFVLAALLLFVKQRVNLAFASLALATSLKLYPALLTAVLARGQVVRCVLIFTTVLLGTYVPYLDAGRKIIGFLPIYFSEPDEITNIGLPSLLFAVLHPAQAGWVLRLVVLVVAVWLFIRREEGTLSLLRQVYLLMSVHTLLLYPALYPWYLCWLIPLLCFFPSPSWLYFSYVSAFAYITWPTPTWVLWLEYAPLYVLLGIEVTGVGFRVAQPTLPLGFGPRTPDSKL
jgi:hypothetical protein